MSTIATAYFALCDAYSAVGLESRRHRPVKKLRPTTQEKLNDVVNGLKVSQKTAKLVRELLTL